MATTTTSAGQSTPATDNNADEEAFKAKVQRAFALGWHVAELCYLPKDVHTDGSAQDPLPPAPDLDLPSRANLLIAQISADLDWLGLETTGATRALGAAAQPGEGGMSVIPQLDPIRLPPSTALDAAGAEAAAESLHRPILLRLTVSNAELGKSYSLGVGLARTVLQAYEEVQAVLPEATARETGAGLQLVKERVARGFTEQRVRELWSDIKDLKSRFPPYAADPIAAGVTDWCRWAGAGKTTRSGQPSDSDQLLTTTSRLRRQGQIWRALLSGERKPTDVLLTANYIDGAIDLVRKYASLVLRLLGRNAGTLLVALFMVAVFAVAGVILQKISGSFVTWIAGLLAALGITGASVLAAVKSLTSRAEEALWETELTSAIGVAINYVPAWPDDSEVEKLRDDNPNPNKGPVVDAVAPPAPSGEVGGGPPAS